MSRYISCTDFFIRKIDSSVALRKEALILKNEEVAILMSTYNGEEYIEEQLNSIINQSYSNWRLYIRDDGSSDKTIEIAKKYSSKYPNISILPEKVKENLGVVHSFMKLLENTEADFYMFADQDDFWKKDKVKDTLSMMMKQDYQNIPVCVHTNLSIVNSTLTEKVQSEPKRVWNEFQKVLFSNCVTGCTAMINNKLKEKIKFNDIDYHNIAMHDWWIALIAAQFGKLVYLNEETILYRQHGTNVDGSQKKNTISYILYRLTHYDSDRKELMKEIKIISEFNREYGSNVSGKDAKYLQKYGDLVNNSSFFHNLVLVCKLPPKERTLGGTLFFSYLLVLFNKDPLV